MRKKPTKIYPYTTNNSSKSFSLDGDTHVSGSKSKCPQHTLLHLYPSKFCYG